MQQVLQIGPVVVPVSLLFMFAAVFAAGLITKRAGDTGKHTESVLWQAMLVGLVAARAAFVVQYSASYLAAPLSILDVRDAGWRPIVGFVAAWLVIAWRLSKHRSHRKPLVLAATIGTVIWSAGLLALSVPADKHQMVPSLTLVSLEGALTDLDQFRGKPLVVNLWATWCPPCVREMPVLHRAQADNAAINFVFINQGETAQRVAPWLSLRGLSLRNVLLDSRGVALAAFNQRGLPTTLFFDAQGRLVEARTGELSEATLAEKLTALTADSKL